MSDHTTAASLTADQSHQLEADGYLVLEGVLSPARSAELAAEMDHVWSTFELDGTVDTEDGVRFVENPLFYTPAIQTVLLDPLILEAARAVVGPQVLLNLVNGRSPGPGAAGQPLHDLTRRRGRPFDKCNAIWCLDDFTVDNGATRVLPGSHLDDRATLARMGDPLDPHPDEVVLEAPRGSVVFHNSHLIHSGRANVSDRPRRSIHAAYSRPGVATHYDWTSLPERVVAGLSRPMNQLLGLGAPGALALT